MGTQQLPLCWNSHQTEILATFQRLLVEESLVDVTLACEGISLKAHKTILSACSPFFQDLFLENPCKHPIVIMKDIKYRDLKGIVDFMYHGGINVAPDQLSEFLKTAEALKVKGLTEHSNTSILDLNKRLRTQQKTSQKVAGFQESLSSNIEDNNFVQTPPVREENEYCEQRSNIVNDFTAGSEKDSAIVQDETNTINVKSEPEPNDDTCEEVLPEHSISDDSLLSVHYDERFVPHMEITEGDHNLVLVPRCQQEIVTSETLPHSSDASTHDAVLPLEHISSEESLGVVISPDVADNPEPVMHYTTFENPNITIHSTSNQDIKPVALMAYEESAVCSTSNQLCQEYNSAGLRVKRIVDFSEQRGFTSNEEVDPTEWVETSIEEISIEENPNDAFGHQSSLNSGMKGRQKIRKSYVQQKCEKFHWPLEIIRKAIQAIHNGMTIRQSASLFNMPPSTLFDHLKRSKEKDNTNNYSSLDKELLKHIKSKCPSGLSLSQMQQVALSLATKKKIPHPFGKQKQGIGKVWLSRFIARHPIVMIKLRMHESTKGTSSNRISPGRTCKVSKSRINVKNRRYGKKTK